MKDQLQGQLNLLNVKLARTEQQLNDEQLVTKELSARALQLEHTIADVLYSYVTILKITVI